jgi:hypothetical protein
MPGLRWFAAGWFAMCTVCVAVLTVGLVPRRPAVTQIVVGGPMPALQVVDVVRGLDATLVATILRLAPCERIAAINDEPTPRSWTAEIALRERDLGAAQVLDVMIAGANTDRRAIVVIH